MLKNDGCVCFHQVLQAPTTADATHTHTDQLSEIGLQPGCLALGSRQAVFERERESETVRILQARDKLLLALKHKDPEEPGSSEVTGDCPN